MKKLFFVFLALSFMSSAHSSDIKACDKKLFDFIKKITEENGYFWPGTIEDCTALFIPQNNTITYISGPWSLKSMHATFYSEPTRIQFKRSGMDNLFCVVKTSRSWNNIGVNCR